MSEPTGIFARIRMSEATKTKLYKDFGQGLIEDYNLITNAKKASVLVDEIIQKEYDGLEIPYFGAAPGDTGSYEERMNAYYQKKKEFETKYKDLISETVTSADFVIIRYDVETQSLFFHLMFYYDGLSVIDVSESFETFMEQITHYKEGEGADLIFFSSWANSLLEGGFYDIWRVQSGEMTKIDEAYDKKEFEENLNECNRLMNKYFYDIQEAYTTYDTETYPGVTYTDTDEEGMKKAMEENGGLVDRELIALWGIE